MIPQTPQLGGWLISTAGRPAVTPDMTWRYSSVIRSTSDANDGSSGVELWAHDTSNASTWRVADIAAGLAAVAPEHIMAILVGDTLYFSAEDGSSGTELWAHDTSNASTWRVADINSGAGSSSPGELHGDTRR